MQYLTLGEAEDEVGVAKSTISRAIKAGRLSATKNEHGHYQIDPAELFRVYPPKPRNTDEPAERNATQHPVAQDATAQNATQSSETTAWMMKRLDEVESKLNQTEKELEEKEKAYDDLKEIYSALPSPETFDAKLAEEVTRLEKEKADALAKKQQIHDQVIDQERMLAAKRMSESRQESEQWKAEISRRQEEIEQARLESEKLREKTERERKAREALSEQLNALESRGPLARLFNRKPKISSAG